ncbi:hypothetical protein L6164_023692 [Bauhinia variegata]|uniref:Uncharacterized protein n=1 Tax=Bauhinia variegata TaxID=167791 RepID=A0ACB9MJ46_BAUVA|nr:hypothetical protein L6164_023692 [Bauhinia variegata]
MVLSSSDVSTKGSPAKVLWYLPIIPHFKQLFSNPNDAKCMIWHAAERQNDGKLHYPIDSPQWKTIDQLFLEFENETRNLRVGLATNGMNPRAYRNFPNIVLRDIKHVLYVRKAHASINYNMERKLFTLVIRDFLGRITHVVDYENPLMTITRLCLFFNAICNKVIDLQKLDELENDIVIILCQLEMYFQPSFFDIIIHLIIHLIWEIRLCGPIHL